MMDRQQMIQILASMDEDKLTQALGAAGISCGPKGSYRDEMGSEEPDDQLVSWNQTKVEVPRSKRPALYDKSANTTPAPKPAVRAMDQSAYLGPEPSGQESWAPQGAAMGEM